MWFWDYLYDLYSFSVLFSKVRFPPHIPFVGTPLKK